jgi:type II secretory ATPase GspE/PulE/Tfp pilus assembly ATPase PilB-like protein
LLNSALTGILAQRLARTLCVSCRHEVDITAQDEALLKGLSISVEKIFKSMGCSLCRYTGYKGRTGIFELLTLSSGLRTLIAQRPLVDDLYRQASRDGHLRLLDDAALKITAGITSVTEIYRLFV